MRSTAVALAFGLFAAAVPGVGCGPGVQRLPVDAGVDQADGAGEPTLDAVDSPGESATDTGSSDTPAVDVGSDTRADAPLVNATITQLTPSSLPVGTTGFFTLVIDGRDFPPNPLVSFDGNVWSAQINSPTQLQASIPSAALGVTPRRVEVQVTRIADPPLDSNILYFEVTARDAATGN